MNDEARIALLREYARLPEGQPLAVYPGCFREPPPPDDRGRARAARSIPNEALVLAYSGVFGHGLGAEWMLAALDAVDELHVMAQLVDLDALTRMLLTRTRAAARLHLDPARLSWRAAWASMGAADIGMAIYHHPGPQFQHMGTSSNRLCMFLAMGIPVVASRQPSFEFVEKLDCGILVETEAEFVHAIGGIRRRLPTMRANALRCAREHIDAPGRYVALREALKAVVA